MATDTPQKNNPKNKTVNDKNARLPICERAVLVHVDFSSEGFREDLTEFKELAYSAGAEPVAIITGTRRAPDSKYFVGTGKVNEIKQALSATNAKLVLFNHQLSPGQERNLEKHFQSRVLDRTGLILDIFAQRARSFEGKLQVELALLKHLSTRLIRGWTHLERQRGGIGLRGPGETQLETDRRLIKNRIQFITKRLNKVRKQREQGRRSRRKATIPTVALVGYTNAGKSTLFNYLTGEAVYVANRLFATLDPTLRRVEIPGLGPIILADTVGFIRHLPHDLVEAFRATLEEVSEADLLLHVVDSSDENKKANMVQVDEVLKSIGADDVPTVLVFNKIDLTGKSTPATAKGDNNLTNRVWISAQNKIGIAELQKAILENLGEELIEVFLKISPAQAKLRADLYQENFVKSEAIDTEGFSVLELKLPNPIWKKIEKRARKLKSIGTEIK